MTEIKQGPSSPARLTVAEAKARFAACLRKADQGEATLITRHGKPVAALVPAEDLDQLLRLRSAGPEGGLASLFGGWEGSDDLADLVASVRRTGPRTRRGRG